MEPGSPAPASPPTMSPGEGWTVATYAAHNEALRQAQWRFDAERDRRYTELAAAASRAVEVALEKATAALDIRLERMNEFRDQITTERTDYARKDQVEALIAGLRLDLRQLQDDAKTSKGRDLGIMGLAVATAASLALSLIKLFIGG